MSDQTPPPYPSYPGDQGTPGYGAQPQPYAQPAYGQVMPYASWWSRVGAYLLDGLVVMAVLIVPFGVGAAIAFAGAKTDPVTDELTDVNPLGFVIIVLGYLAVFAFAIWNQAIRQGRTGQSLGKQWVGIQVVRADSGQFLGAGTGFLRLIMNSILGSCFLNYLWPLWDERKQTWHDKVVGSVVIRK